MFYDPVSNFYAGSGRPTKKAIFQVLNRESVDRYFVMPGEDELFMYEEEPVVARKHVDAAGVAAIYEYDLVPRVKKTEPEYVTREEFNQFVRRFANEPVDQQPTAAAVPAVDAASPAANAAAGSNAAIGTAADDAGA